MAGIGVGEDDSGHSLRGHRELGTGAKLALALVTVLVVAASALAFSMSESDEGGVVTYSYDLSYGGAGPESQGTMTVEVDTGIGKVLSVMVDGEDIGVGDLGMDGVLFPSTAVLDRGPVFFDNGSERVETDRYHVDAAGFSADMYKSKAESPCAYQIHLEFSDGRTLDAVLHGWTRCA